MLNLKLENKAAKPVRTADPAEARDNLQEAEAELARMEADARKAEAEIQAAYSAGNTAKLKELRTKRDALWNRHGGLVQDVEAAKAALLAAEEAEGARVLEREIATLPPKYAAMAERVDAQLEAMAALYREVVALHGEHAAVVAKREAHARRYGSAPEVTMAADLLRWPHGFLGALERVTKAITRLAQHRAFLGDAKTVREATWRMNNEEYRTRREQIERMAARDRARSDDSGTLGARQRERTVKRLFVPLGGSVA